MRHPLLRPLTLALALAAPSAALAGTGKIDVCHVSTSGTVVIRVSESAFPAHESHGDRAVVAESCNGIDDDCDGTVDEGAAASTWYADGDGDGFGDPAAAVEACAAPAGFVDDATDCDDTAAAVNPLGVETCNGDDDDCDGETDEAGAEGELTWYGDGDGDGYGDVGASLMACEAPEGFDADASDCDDATAAVSPGATEGCNDVDDDCDGAIDEAGATGEVTWYTDGDGDGYGTAGTTGCDQPADTVTLGGDCDDTYDEAFPGGVEVCDSSDNDCNGAEDDLDGCSVYVAGSDEAGVTWAEAAADCEGQGLHLATIDDAYELRVYADYAVGPVQVWVGAQRTSREGMRFFQGYDGEGWSWTDGAAFSFAPWAPGEPSDGAAERCGAYEVGGAGLFDLDCDTLLHLWFCEDDGGEAVDADGDGYTWAAGDCDDGIASFSPASAESCDGFDDDCDGSVDEDFPGEVAEHWYMDQDEDGYGVFEVSIHTCEPLAPQDFPMVTAFGDCDDADATSNPGAEELCNGLDDDCDGEVDNGTFYADADGDGSGDAATPVTCVEPGDGVPNSGDCDDTDPGDAGPTWYVDGDGDGVGDAPVSSCAQPAGTVAVGGDCDDAAADVRPGAADTCGDGLDSDCDGSDACACPCFDAATLASEVDPGVSVVASYLSDTVGTVYVTNGTLSLYAASWVDDDAVPWCQLDQPDPTAPVTISAAEQAECLAVLADFAAAY